MNSLSSVSSKQAVTRLVAICSSFSEEASTEKLFLLRFLQQREIRAVYLLKRLHSCLCYLRAFPDNRAIYSLVCQMLRQFAQRTACLDQSAQALLYDSGISGTQVHYSFSYASMSWLIQHYANYLDIDWESCESPEKLDKLLQFLISPAEQQIFDDGMLDTRGFMRLARGDAHVSELAWLFKQSKRNRSIEKLLENLYDSSEIQITWSLQQSSGSRTYAHLPRGKIHYRKQGMRKPGNNVVTEILKPMRIRHLPDKQASTLLNVINAALLVRSREVYHMQHASEKAVYLGSCGEGVEIAFVGATPERRFNLETGFGYMVFANGVPVAYGGVSPLFNQGNTGLNVLDEYRRGESAYIYSQVLRMGHSLFGIYRFVVNPYQFGEDNREALLSGAFWFYYRLGFRPVDEDIMVLSEKEFAKISKQRSYRTPLPTLKRLASCDLQLKLPGAGSRPLFPEQWLGRVAAGAAKHIAEQSKSHHHLAIANIVSDLCKKLEIRDLSSWNKNERNQLQHLAPVCALIDDLAEWQVAEKRALLKMIKAKAASSERNYARLMAQHQRFYKGLRRFCLHTQR